MDENFSPRVKDVIQYSKEDHKEAIRNQTGLPWYKQPAPKGQNHRN